MKLLPAIVFAIASVIAFAPGVSHADAAGELYIDPQQSYVLPGSTFDVDIVAVPPDQSLAAWVLRVHFDSSVVAFDGCDSLASPPGYVFVADCQLQSSPNGPVVSVGGALDPDTGLGLTTTSALATITFEVIGVNGDFTDLEIDVVDFLGPDPQASSLNPVITDGYVEVTDNPPPTPAPSPSPTPTPAPTPIPIGGSVELVTTSTSSSGFPPLAAVIGLAVAGFVALAVRAGVVRLSEGKRPGVYAAGGGRWRRR